MDKKLPVMTLQLGYKCISSLPLCILVWHVYAKFLHFLGKLVLVVAEGALEVMGAGYQRHPLHTRPVSPTATAGSPQDRIANHL